MTPLDIKLMDKIAKYCPEISTEYIPELGINHDPQITPTLPHVLIAFSRIDVLKQTIAVNSHGYILIDGKLSDKQWNLTKDLYGQSVEFKEWLDGVLE